MKGTVGSGGGGGHVWGHRRGIAGRFGIRAAAATPILRMKSQFDDFAAEHCDGLASGALTGRNNCQVIPVPPPGEN